MKKIFAVPIAALSLVLSVSPVFAMESTASPAMTRQEWKQERTELRCDILDSRSKLMIGRYNENYPRHVANAKKVADGVKTLVATLKAEGKDTSKLEASLAVLAQKVQTFDQQATAVVDQLKVAQQYLCGQSKGQYATEIKKAHDLAVTAHATLVDLRSYYQNTVRPEIKALRAQ